jgi:hypothetical protein
VDPGALKIKAAHQMHAFARDSLLNAAVFCSCLSSDAPIALRAGIISPAFCVTAAPTPLDFRQLFKLRLVVAALGETQRLGWWNSGVLTSTGEFLFMQGFPRSRPLAQTRAGFWVAQLACDEALAIHRMAGPTPQHQSQESHRSPPGSNSEGRHPGTAPPSDTQPS